MTKAVALRRSGLTSTAVTVIEALAQLGIAHVAALEELGEQMAQLLADAQLALAGPRCVGGSARSRSSFADERRRRLHGAIHFGRSRRASGAARQPSRVGRTSSIVEALDHVA